MLREVWALLCGVIVFAGLVAGNIAVVALGALVGAACYGATLWARFSLRRLRYERVIPEDHAFPGEQVELRLRITNEKPLPLPWVEVVERFPSAMVRRDDEEFHGAGQVTVAQTEWRTSVWSHQRVSRSYELLCPERGVYEVGPAVVASGDPFGLFRDQRPEERRSRIIVYPRTVRLGELGLPARRPYGEQTGGLSIFEDPSRIAGLRDYAPGDSRRRIDWNATARLGRMQSRVYDPASSRHLLICLNAQTIVPIWAGAIPDVLERTVSVAASVARDAYDTRYSVGLLANSSFPEADRSIRIPPGRRPEQFIRILEALAIVSTFPLEPLSAMLAREEHRLQPGTTIVAVSGIMTPDLGAALLRLARRGHAVVILKTSDERWDAALTGDIEVLELAAVDLPWRRERDLAGVPS
jgi:uncharacterized protein (DUF58 family)